MITLSRSANHRAVIISRSNDAGRAIGTAMATRWWNSNHFAPYGNTYFRIAHTFAVLTPPIWTDEELNELEKKEINHHWSLLLTSYVSMVGIVVVSLFVFGVSWPWVPFLTGAGLLCMFLNPTYIHYLFMAHPDHILMLAALVASYATAIWFNNKTDKTFLWMCFWWGVGFAVKRSLVLYTPAFFFMFARPWKGWLSVKKFLVFVATMFLFYQLVGFPQNFSIYKHVNFLLFEAHDSLPPDLASVSGYFVRFWEQISVLVPVLLIGAVFFRSRKHVWTRETNIGMAGFFILGLLPLVSRNMMTPHDHHTFPIVATALVLLAVLVSGFPIISQWWMKLIGVASVLLTVVISTPHAKVSLDHGLQAELMCDKEILEVYRRSKKILDDGGLILRETYVPRDQSRPERAENHWGVNWDEFGKKSYTHLMLKKDFYMRFMKPAPVYKPQYRKDEWNASYAFYPQIVGKSEFVDKQGFSWKKIYSDKCHFEIWEKAKKE